MIGREEPDQHGEIVARGFAHEHNEWLFMQEMGNDYSKLHRRYDYDNGGDDPYEAQRRIELEEEEEKAKIEYFKRIAKEEKRG